MRKGALAFLTLAVFLAWIAGEAQDKTAASPSPSSTAEAKLGEKATPGSSRDLILVKEFSVKEGTGWPYDRKQLQVQTVAEMKAKFEGQADVSATAPAPAPAHTYTLEGEVVSWHPGNRATRMIVGFGSGHETAEIRYWLTGEGGKKIFDHTDTIRAEFWGNEYAGSVGQLAHPFASKITDRQKEAKIF